MLRASTALPCPVLVLLLDDIVGCGSRDFQFLLFVLFFDALALARGAGLVVANPIAVAVAMVLVTAGSAGFVRDLVLRAGAVGLTASLAAAFRRCLFLSPLLMAFFALFLGGESVDVATSDLPSCAPSELVVFALSVVV